MRRYREQGIEKLLSPITRNKASKFITPETHREIEARPHSKQDPFSGYVEVQQWLSRAHGVEIGHKWLWAYMTTEMDSKLRVPRKVNVNKAEDAEDSSFKTARHTVTDQRQSK